ncbi:MAG: serine/threonine-protein kinase [Myxococcota bacterium]
MTEPSAADLDDPKSAGGFERTWDELVEGLEPGDVIDGKYRLERLLGHGAMGFVLRAWHEKLEQPVAIKFLLPELVADEEAQARFEREARAAFKIRSEHVTRVLDVGRIDGTGRPYIVMELLEGIDLGQLVDEGAMPHAQAITFVLQASEAVAEAHDLGIVHRDLKPDNLFVARRAPGLSSVKVLDFGLSKLQETRAPGIRPRALTQEAQIMGTAHYMSPEQWVASKSVGPAADQWALGVILYEAITGISPFSRNNMAAMCNAVLREEPAPMSEIVPGLPSGLDAVVHRCLAKRIDDRWPSVAAFAEALRRFVPEASAAPSTLASTSRSTPRDDASLAASGPPSASVSSVPSPPSSPVAMPRLGLDEGGDEAHLTSWAEVAAGSRRSALIRRAVVVAVALSLGIAGWLWLRSG